MVRPKRALLPLLAALAVTLLLAACSGPASSTPSYTPQDAASSLKATGTDAQDVAQASNDNLGLSALGGLYDVGSLSSGNSLPSGSYVWNANTSSWDTSSTATTHDLRLEWDFTHYSSTGTPSTHTAVAQIDWVSTTTINGQQVPTHATAALTVDGNAMGNLDASGSWQSTSCGTILEPASLTLSGAIGTSSNQIKVSSFSLKIPKASGTLSTQGKLSATAAGKTVTLDWNVAVDGSATRDATTCALTSFTPTGGSLSVGLTTPSHSASLAFDASNVQMSQYGGLASVVLSNGKLTIDNSVATTFQGTLDDSNQNGTPGENVTLTFKGGTQETLEQFLQSPDFSSLGLSAFQPVALSLLGVRKLF